ncbi:hypothetical protein PR048_021628 [Dryococelus australis]|uniref:Uncharacterized protein n=1 Tax=Dryococelus australis TaxID=614101 RepID=A0ABQ9GYR6_9NEOP|nr:hypothetical protein PR048_021628 [Dryococelus australis]
MAARGSALLEAQWLNDEMAMKLQYWQKQFHLPAVSSAIGIPSARRTFSTKLEISVLESLDPIGSSRSCIGISNCDMLQVDVTSEEIFSLSTSMGDPDSYLHLACSVAFKGAEDNVLASTDLPCGDVKVVFIAQLFVFVIMANMADVLARLSLAECHVKCAYALSHTITTDPTKINIFLANVRDLPEDYVTLEASSGKPGKFSLEEHSVRMINFKEQYYIVMETAESFRSVKAIEEVHLESSRSSQMVLQKINLPHHPELSTVEKFVYLKTSLSGKLLSLIQALPISEVNFCQAPDCGLLLTIITKNIAALEALDVPVKTWDLILLAIFKKKKDEPLQTQWEMTLSDSELPTLRKLIKFLEKHCRCQKTATYCQTQSTVVPPGSKIGNPLNHDNCALATLKCALCKDLHAICKCPRFVLMSPKECFGSVKDNKLYLKGLQTGHQFKDCPFSSSCRHYQSRHHSLLHFTAGTIEKEVTGNSKLADTVMLSTAMIDIQYSSGNFQTIKALFDSGNQAHFITDNCLSLG